MTTTSKNSDQEPMKASLPTLIWTAAAGLIGLFALSFEARSATMPAATATVVNGFVVSVTVTSGGSGLTEAPDVSFVGGGGSGATARAVIANGSVTEVQVLTAGSGYTALPLVVFGPSSGGYLMPTATAAVINGFVVSVTVTSGGFGYVEVPEVSFVGGGGSGAIAQAVIANGSVAEIRIISAGAGYTSTPLVFITPPLASSLETIAMAPMLTIRGTIGSANQIQYREDMGDTNVWKILTNFVLAASPMLFVDTSAPPAPRRFYQVVNLNELPPPPVTVNPHPDLLAWIEPGSFLMGSPATEQDRESDEEPQTQVTLTYGFWMGKFEVTQGQYLDVSGTNPSGHQGSTNLPVEMVSYVDATNFCARLSERERTAGLLPHGYAYRLPTEAEWEYACRAGTTTRFWFGDDPNYSLLGAYAWIQENTGVNSQPVGGKPANPWGLYDMHGNVFEWCQDLYGAYPGGSVVDYFGPTTGSDRVVRGGSMAWSGGSIHRSARRTYGPVTYAQYDCGFRVVLAPVSP